MERVPEKGRDTAGQGRATDPNRNDQLDGPGRVSLPSPSDALELTDSKGERLNSDATPVESGGCGGSCGGGRRRDTAVRASVTERRSSDGTLCRAERGKGNVESSERGIQSLTGREASPSMGWRGVVASMSAEEGCSHE